MRKFYYSKKNHTVNVWVKQYAEFVTDGFIEITPEEYNKYWLAQAPDGKRLAINKYPFVLEDIPAQPVCECRTAKLAEMRKECGDHIDAGFECDALGYPCQYHNSANQQTTMRNATIAGGKIWRNEAFTLHTQAEAQIVFAESISEIERLRTVYANKCIYINDESRTVSEITAVTWSSVE